VRFTRSSGNVFKDLGLENPDDLLQKSRLVSVIHSVMRKRRLSQSEAAQMMGVSQPDLSKLIRGRTAGFSMERLVTMLSAIGVSTHITLEVPTRFTHRGRIVVDEVQQDQRKPQVF
jgi:predicted XRE-type DNA-binding protein